MNRRSFLGVAVLLWSLVSGIAVAGEPPVLVDLHDVSPLRDWFQRQNGNVRAILLLSPSCTSCFEGFSAVQKMLQRSADPRLRVAVVWMPVFEKDSRKGAEAISGFRDGRLVYFWDPYRAAGETWQSVLKLRGTAWDVYLLYGASSFWNAPDPDPALPDFWMHQLKEVPGGLPLDPAVFEGKIKDLLK